MRKQALLALILVMTLTLSSCALIVKDEEVDRQTPVIEVAGKVFTKGDVLAETEAILEYYAYTYNMYYGIDYDVTNPEIIADARAQAVDSLVQSAVLDQKIHELGYDVFTPEEEAEMEASAQATYQSYSDMITTYFTADTELTGDALQAEIDRQLAELGYPTREEVLANERISRMDNRLYDEVTRDVTVSDEEVSAEYERLVASDKTSYTEFPESYDYASAVSNGQTVYYTPAGYRYVKHILVTFTDEAQAAIDAAATEEERAAATQAAIAAIQPTLDEIQAKLAAGESFESLITAYNQDPGMTADSVGYLVSAETNNWVPEFRDASMALAAVGDVSGPVASSYGVHIIQYAGDVAEGPAAFETVSDALTEQMLTQKRDALYSQVLNQWVEETGAKVYMNRL